MSAVQRRALLHSLIDSKFDGSRAEFARAIKRSPAQVSQWLSGNRALGDAGARVIEKALALPLGYFDSPPHVAEPHQSYKAQVVKIPPKRDSVIEAVIRIMEQTDSEGRSMALAAIKVALSGHVPKAANSRK